MKLIYVCSPYRGNPPYSRGKSDRNIKKAENFCKDVINDGHTPVAPHCFYQSFFSDTNPRQRAKAIEHGLNLLRKCDEVWVFSMIISEGMAAEIKLAKELGIPVVNK